MIRLLARFHKVFYIFLFSFITTFCWKIISFMWWIIGLLPVEAPVLLIVLCSLPLMISAIFFIFIIAPTMVHKIIDISNSPKNIEADKIYDLGRDLYTKETGIPIVDIYFNFEATFRLIKNGSPEAVHRLAYAISLDVDKEVRIDVDKEVRRTILCNLPKITDKFSIDRICQIWLNTRHQDLANLIVKKGWIASSSVELKVLTALKTNKLEIITNSSQEIVEPLLEAFKDKDIEIANRASECAIIVFDNPKYKKFLLDLIIEQEHPVACQIAVKGKYAPNELDQRALFYFLTEQWNEYENLDFDYSLLQQAYKLANERLRKRIAGKAKKSGRLEWVQAIAGGRKSQQLEKMTDAEWGAMLDVLSNNKRWEEIWQLAQKAPAIWSKKLLQNLKQASWLPSLEEERTGFKNLKQLAEKFSGITISSMSCRKSFINHNGNVERISFSPDGQLLASCSYYCISLWQMPDCNHLATLFNHSDSIKEINFSPDGQFLASYSYDKTVRLWRMPDGQLLATITGYNTEEVSLYGQFRAIYSYDETVRLWRVSDGQLLATITRHTEKVVSPDGQLRASCYSHDKTVRLLRNSDGQLLDTLTGHTEKVRGISFSPDGQLLASYSPDGTVRLWRMPDGQLLATITDYTDCVAQISFSPDGQYFTEHNGSSTIRLWSSSIFQLSRLPIRQLSLHNREQIHQLLQDSEITEQEQHSLRFMQALINRYQQFDVEVEDAPQLVSTGEFDIEIEG